MEYTETHEWIDQKGDIATVGLSEKALNELGEIVYLDLPELGQEVSKGDPICVLESSKAAADLYTPLTGVVEEINELLKTDPEKINELPETDKWLYKLKVK